MLFEKFIVFLRWILKTTMAVHKKEEFTQEDQDLAALAKALAHPARIAILKVLARQQTCVCGEIVEVMPLAQSTVSQHLKELLNAGLIQGTVDGAKSCYCINPASFLRLERLLGSFISDTKERCC